MSTIDEALDDQATLIAEKQRHISTATASRLAKAYAWLNTAGFMDEMQRDNALRSLALMPIELFGEHCTIRIDTDGVFILDGDVPMDYPPLL